MNMIEWWALLPDGRRVSTKRPEVGRGLKAVACFEDTDGRMKWWCHTFYETQGRAESGMKAHLFQRSKRLEELGLKESTIDLRDAILPVYFLKRQ